MFQSHYFVATICSCIQEGGQNYAYALMLTRSRMGVLYINLQYWFTMLDKMLCQDRDKPAEHLFTHLSIDKSYNLDKTAIRKVKLCMCWCGKKIEDNNMGIQA